MHPRSTRRIGKWTEDISRAAVAMDRLVHKVRRTYARAHYTRARKTAKTNRRRDNPLQCSAGYRSVSDTGPPRRHRARSPSRSTTTTVASQPPPRRPPPRRQVSSRTRFAVGVVSVEGWGEHRRRLGLRSSYPFSLRLPMRWVCVCVCVLLYRVIHLPRKTLWMFFENILFCFTSYFWKNNVENKKIQILLLFSMYFYFCERAFPIPCSRAEYFLMLFHT